MKKEEYTCNHFLSNPVIGPGMLVSSAISTAFNHQSYSSNLNNAVGDYYVTGVSFAVTGGIGAGVRAVGGVVRNLASQQFTKHVLERIAVRGGSKLHALIAKYFGRPLGPKVDSMRRWSYNYATKNTRVAVNSAGKIITYIRNTKSWWRF